VRIQGVSWDKNGSVIARDYIFLKGKENHKLGKGLFVQHRIVSAVKGKEFFSDRMQYIVLRVRWYNVIVLNLNEQVRRKVMIHKTVL